MPEPPPNNGLRNAAALALALLAPALGGGTAEPAIAGLMAGIGILALAAPARRLGTGFLIGAGLLLVVALGWALPAGESPWRQRLLEAGFHLPGCGSPQPWISLRAWILLLAGVTWAGWCAGQAWSAQARRWLCEGMAAGICAIAMVALAGREAHVPGWPRGTGLGPFENRNQTGILFAVGAFLMLACGVGRLRSLRQRGGMGVFVAYGMVWLAGLAIYIVALGANHSRSGPLLFIAMSLLWVFTVAPQWKHKPETLAAGVALALLMGALFLLTGGGVLSRLAESQFSDFRLKIFKDTLWMIRDSPWRGVGPGNFNAIFPLYRHASILQERVLHPESDWLWLTAEMGFPGLAAIAGLLAWMGVMAWRGLAGAGDRAVRLAACIGCIGMLAHSFIDVPGHRLGSMMPALLLLGIAAGSGEDEPRRAGIASRMAGAAVLALGLAGLAMLTLRIPTPLQESRASLQWAPLDWLLYAKQAQAEGSHGKWTEALGDFRRARFLEPDYAGLPFQEGGFWLQYDPQLVIEPWRAALRECPVDRRGEMYQQMLGLAFPSHPELHAELWSLASTQQALQIIYFGWATPEEFKVEIAEILHEDPGLDHFDAEEMRQIFALWMAKGDARQLASLLVIHPDWMRSGYRALAEYDAAQGDLAGAVALMQRYLPPPRLPQVATMPHAEAIRRFNGDPGDLAAGVSIYEEASAAGRDDDALLALRRMTAAPHCPGYIYWLEARILVKRQKLDEAWQALRQIPDPAKPEPTG